MQEATTYRVISVDDTDIDSEQMLVKITPVTADEVDITVESDGTLTITGKEVTNDDDVPSNTKYRLEPEGDMYRLYATRTIRRNVHAGTRGGLVGNRHVLDDTGSCWIYDGSNVSFGCRVRQDATVASGCDISGSVDIAGCAHVANTKISGDDITIDGSAHITHSTLSSVPGADGLHIRGASHVCDSVIEKTYEAMLISGCNINSAHIRNQYELLSVHHNSWGWLSAYRNKNGTWQFSIGCKTRHSADALRELAVETRDYDPSMTGLHAEMLEPFLAMVEVSSRGWVGYTPPAPVEDAKHDQYGTEL